MAERVIIRGDSYGLRRPLYRIELLTVDNQPFDLTGCVVRTTYKPRPTSIEVDPHDDTAFIKHELHVDENGVASVQAGLHMIGDPTDGQIEERLTSSETSVLPLDIVLFSDIELTDPNGEKFTWIMEEGLRAIDAYTNRDS